MYVGFLVMGIGTILESNGRVPLGSWRVGFSMAFFVEGMVFYGHSLEQHGIERVLHFIMVCFSWVTSLSFLISSLGKSAPVFLTHVTGLTMMFAKGIWFFVISDVL